MSRPQYDRRRCGAKARCRKTGQVPFMAILNPKRMSVALVNASVDRSAPSALRLSEGTVQWRAERDMVQTPDALIASAMQLQLSTSI
mgnify:CR=1 FL=1